MPPSDSQPTTAGLKGAVYPSQKIAELVAENARLRAEIERLCAEVVTFCGLWATSYARERGLPDGHLYPTHYDILDRAGARMDDFTRAEIDVTQAADISRLGGYDV